MSSSETTGPTQRSVRRPSWRRRVIATALGVGLLFAAGWTIAWQLLAMRAEASVEAWVSERRALGDRIQHGPVRVGGFPLTVEIQTREVHWVREDGVTLLTAAAPDVIASAPVWNPFRLTLRPTSWGRASVAGAWGSITGDADMAAAVVTLSRQGPERIELTLRNLDLIGPGGAMLARIDALDASIDPAPARNPGDTAGAVPATMTLNAHADGVRPVGVEELPFDGPATVSLAAALRGPVDPSAGLPGLALWRDAGGVIDVDRLVVSWSPVDLVGDGTFALDAALRPEGAGTAEIQGVAETLDRLVAQGRMKPGQAALLKLAAIAASEPSADGSGHRFKAPLTVQDGTVRLGQIAIAKVRSIAD